MKVKECMTREIEVASPDLSLSEAARKMRDGNFGSLLIGEKDRLTGMLTDRDIAIRAVAEGKDPQRTKVREAMTQRILYCYEDESVDEVARNFGDNQVRRLPVLNRSKRLVGMLSVDDLVRSDAKIGGEALSRITKGSRRDFESRAGA